MTKIQIFGFGLGCLEQRFKGNQFFCGDGVYGGGWSEIRNLGVRSVKGENDFFDISLKIKHHHLMVLA